MSGTLTIFWDFPALRRLYELPPHTAMLVDRAVVRFAQTGEGAEWDPPYYRLRAGFYDVALAVDTQARTVSVLRLFRVR